MSDGKIWQILLKDWNQKHQALLDFPLFERGLLRLELLPEYQKLKDEEELARKRKDEFIEELKNKI